MWHIIWKFIVFSFRNSWYDVWKILYITRKYVEGQEHLMGRVWRGQSVRCVLVSLKSCKCLVYLMELFLVRWLIENIVEELRSLGLSQWLFLQIHFYNVTILSLIPSTSNFPSTINTSFNIENLCLFDNETTMNCVVNY